VQLRITLTKSPVSQKRDQQLTVRSLGLRRMHQTVVHPDTRPVRGMINRVRHLVTVEEVSE
jgi:large subunit ribosomal protein L30